MHVCESSKNAINDLLSVTYVGQQRVKNRAYGTEGCRFESCRVYLAPYNFSRAHYRDRCPKNGT